MLVVYMRLRSLVLPALLTLLGLASAARADDLFRLEVEGTTDSLTATGSSARDLLGDLASQSGQFAVFEGQAFTASLDYAGFDDAIVLTSNDDNSVITLSIPSQGFSETFDASNGDLEEQLEDFLIRSGPEALAILTQATNEDTLIGVMDGNPASMTALTSAETFRLFGEFRNPFGPHVQGGDGLRFYANYSHIEAGDFDGYLVEGALTGAIRFTDQVALVLDGMLAYRNLEDAEVYTTTFIAGVPIRLTPEMTEEQPVFWQITPSFHSGGAGSADQIAGGIILGGSVTNLVGIRAGDFLFSSGQQIGYFDGQPFNIQDVEFDTRVEQWIFRGSLVASYGGFGGSGAYLQGGVVYTDFLEDAGVDNYISPFAGIGVKLGGESVFRIGVAADLGDDFTMYRGEAEVRFAF